MYVDTHPKPGEPQLAGQAILAGRLERAAAAASVVVLILHAIYLNVPAEDSFITFRFARHLAAGLGIVWNAGEAPVEGYTNFLWLLISALTIRLGLDVVRVTQLLGVIFSVAALLVTALFARHVFGLSRQFALLAAFMLAVSGPFAAWAASSMETNLFAFLVLAGCYFFARWVQINSLPHLAAAQGLLLAATLTRPEGFLVFGVLAGLGLLLRPERAGRRGFWRYAAALLVYLVPFAVYFAWRYQYFGYLLPNTFYAKTGGGLAQYMRGAKYTALFVLLFVLPLTPVAAARYWERPWRQPFQAARGIGGWTAWARRSVGPVVCLAVIAAYTAYVIYVGGDYMAMFRFFVPILPLIYLLFARAAAALFEITTLSAHKLRLARGLLAAAVLFTLLQSTPLEQELFGQPWFMHGTWRGVQHERWHVARNTLIGEFFRDLKRSDEESLALLGIGIIPYISDMEVRSFHGLVDPYIAHKPTEKEIGSGVAGHEKVDFVSVIREKPTYIMVDTGDLYPEPQAFPSFDEEIDAFVRENYELKTAWLVDTANHESGYLHYLELKK